MSRRKTELVEGESRRVAAEDLDPALFDDVPDTDAAALDPALGGLLSELSDGASVDAKVVVKKLVNERGQIKHVHCMECAPSEFSIPDLQANFGGGDYRVQVFVRDSGKSNYMPCRANKKISIAEPMRPKPMGAIMPTMQPNFAAEVTAALDRQAAMFREMVAPLLNGASSRSQHMAEFTAMAKMMGELRGPASAPAGMDLGQLAAIFKLLKSTNEDERDKGADLLDGMDGNTKLLFKALEIFGGAMQKGQAAQAQAQLPANSTLSVTATNAAPAASMPILQEPAQSEGEQTMDIKTGLAMLAQAAKANEEIPLWSGMVADYATDELLDELEKPEWFGKLVSIEPGIAPFQEWFTKLRDAVLKLLNEPEQPTAPTA